MMWYEDPKVKALGAQCDSAIDADKRDELIGLSNKCLVLAEDAHLHPMNRVRYYYFSVNCLNAYKAGTILSDEDAQEKILYIFRKGWQLLTDYEQQEEFQNPKVKSNYWGIRLPFTVNFANSLDDVGRIIPSISLYSTIKDKSFSMAHGNLGFSFYRYAMLSNDSSQAAFLLGESKDQLGVALKIGDTSLTPEAIERFQKILAWEIDNKITKQTISYPDRNMSDLEVKYRKWVASNCLALNPLNDASRNINASYDSSLIAHMIVEIDDATRQELPSLFNEIKQEYVAARYLLYSGINDHGVSYSDRDVRLTDNGDGALYSQSIKQIKAAFRSAFSIFDRIAYFLNIYFASSKDYKRITFKNIWLNKIIKQKLTKNYPLRGLQWIGKDLYSITMIEGYKYSLDPKMSEIKSIRNCSEHRFLKVILDEYSAHENDIEMVINLHQLIDDCVYMLTKCREAIILCTLVVNENEKQLPREENIGTLTARPYDDNFKFQ